MANSLHSQLGLKLIHHCNYLLSTSCLTDEKDQSSNGESNTSCVVIAVLATLLLLVAVVAIIMYFAMRTKTKSEHNNTMIADANVCNLEPSAHSCIPVTDESIEEFEKHSYVDSEDAAAASTDSKLMSDSGKGDEELNTSIPLQNTSPPT